MAWIKIKPRFTRFSSNLPIAIWTSVWGPRSWSAVYGSSAPYPRSIPLPIRSSPSEPFHGPTSCSRKFRQQTLPWLSFPLCTCNDSFKKMQSFLFREGFACDNQQSKSTSHFYYWSRTNFIIIYCLTYTYLLFVFTFK